MLMRGSDDDHAGQTRSASRIHEFLFQGLRFGLVGIMATLGYALAAGGSHTLGSTPYIANLIGYSLGTGISFVGHFYWTFGKRNDHGRHLARFLVVTLAGYLASNAIVFVVLDAFYFPFWIAVVTIALIVPFATWMSGRYWAFR